jgi:hypothetical protein
VSKQQRDRVFLLKFGRNPCMNDRLYRVRT